jgi:hypothetical protein
MSKSKKETLKLVPTLSNKELKEKLFLKPEEKNGDPELNNTLMPTDKENLL